MWVLMLYIAWGGKKADWNQVPFESESACSKARKEMRIENPTGSETRWVVVAFCRPAVQEPPR